MIDLQPLEFFPTHNSYVISEIAKKLEEIAFIRGMKSFSIIDHSSGAQKANINVSEEKVFFMTNIQSLEIMIKTSPYSVSETVKKLQETISKKGIKLFSIIDHSGEAQKVNLELSEEKVVIFGDPKVGTFLMQENPLIGLELPLRLLVWQDETKQVKIAYIDPVSLGKSYGINKNIEVLKKLTAGLALVVAEATQ